MREMLWFHANNGSCPYRSQRVWENIYTQTESLPNHTYEALLNQGFRRSGYSIYHPICQGCQACIPIRINTQQFKPTKSQRRTKNNNKDVRCEHLPLHFSWESFSLYQKYQQEWHSSKCPTEEEYRSFLLSSPVDSEMVYYWIEQTLVGVSWIDRLTSIVSSVYFVFEPDFAKRRLGVYSILYEIEYAKNLGYQWLHLGYWIPDSVKMHYKAEYQPAQILLENQWKDFDYSWSELQQSYNE